MDKEIRAAYTPMVMRASNFPCSNWGSSSDCCDPYPNSNPIC